MRVQRYPELKIFYFYKLVNNIQFISFAENQIQTENAWAEIIIQN